MSQARLLSIQVGRVAPLGPQRVPSGFVKHPVTDTVEVGPLGLVGDEQADLTVHGGPDKAVYGYAAAHYPAWIADLPEHAGRFGPGSLGENLTIQGWTEADIRVGDVHAIGDVHLQVCQPRQPCFKLALRFGDNRLPKAMVRNGRAGQWFRSHDNELWLFDPDGLMAERHASIDDRPIAEGERLFRWSQGPRPADHPGLGELGL